MTMPDTVTRTINSIKSLVIIISHIVVAYLLFSLCMTLLFMLCSLFDVIVVVCIAAAIIVAAALAAVVVVAAVVVAAAATG